MSIKLLKRQLAFLSKIQNRISEKTRRKIILLSYQKFVKTQFLGVVEFPSILLIQFFKVVVFPFQFLISKIQGSCFSFQFLSLKGVFSKHSGNCIAAPNFYLSTSFDVLRQASRMSSKDLIETITCIGSSVLEASMSFSRAYSYKRKRFSAISPPLSKSRDFSSA